MTAAFLLIRGNSPFGPGPWRRQVVEGSFQNRRHGNKVPPEKPRLLSKNFFEMSLDETWRVGFVMISNLTGRVVVESSTSRISFCEWTALDPTQHNSNLVYIEFRKACSCWSEGGYRVLQGPLGVVEGPVHCPGFRIHRQLLGHQKWYRPADLGAVKPRHCQTTP